MTIITPRDFARIRKRFKNKKIVFCSGSFDLTHVGHILFFEDCKKQGGVLIVGVGRDTIIKVNKGSKRPILNEKIRLKTIDSLKPVDYCFFDIFSTEKNPLLVLDAVFKRLRPDVYVINNDAFNIPYRQKVAKKYNVKLVILKRYCPKEFDNISTSKIIEKIKNL